MPLGDGEIVRDGPGDRHIQDPAGNWLKLKSSDEYRINPDNLVASELETLLGPGHVQFARQGNGNGRGH